MSARTHEHLVPLADGWTVWRWFRLRGAGFPVRLIDELAMPAAVAAVDHHAEARRAAAAAREAAIAAVVAALERAGGEPRRQLAKALKRLRAGATPEVAGDAAAAEAIARLAAADEAVAARWQDVLAAFEADRRRVAAALRATVASERFREAVTWQNRHALRTGLAKLAELPVEAADRDTRKRELAVCSYLQRYCVKNDTISFFGPVAWGTFRDDVSGASVEPGPRLLAHRTVYYEHWCLHALAQHLAADPQLLPWLAPRRAPTLRVEGRTLWSPVEQRVELDEPLAALLARCDGQRTARELAAELVQQPDLGLGDEDEVHAYLAALAEDGLVSWTLELPPEELYPARYLRGVLEQVGDPGPRERALGKLDRLEAARKGVAAAAGDPAALDAALDAFEQTFTEITGVAATRKPGETYGGRTLLYEDCRRDLACTLGQDVLQRIAPSLALVLASARWYTHAIAQRYRAELRAAYDRLRQQTGSAVLDFRRFWNEIRPLVAATAEGSILREVVAQLHARWREVLQLDERERRVERSSEQLRPLVGAAFRAERPGWPSARYHSPDLLIAAAGADAIGRGDYLVVLGETHTGLNSVLVPVFAKEFPELEQLIRARELDIPATCIAPVWSHERSRADLFSLVPRDLALENGATRSWRPRERVVAESALVVELAGDRVEVRTRDGAHRFDVIAFVEHHLIASSHSQFTLLDTTAHTPRVTIDHLVISRERWHLRCDELAFATLESPVERFAAARQWAHALGLPRRIFAKVPTETKPVYVDLESSSLIDNLARLVRGAPAITISEMLPDVNQTWVVDRDGQRYTSELRMVAVDPMSADAAGARA